MASPFVPDDFIPPPGLELPGMRLEPLGPEHNERDFASWASSIEHIHATPGFDARDDPDPWPREMTLEENLSDLERHAADFATRTGFTYTVLDPGTDDVIGCVYIYPSKDAEHDAKASSWVRASHAELDVPLRRGVSSWLARDWPFSNVAYASPGRLRR
jgi:hypothetical protein